jgi:hypothetical protein
MQNFAREHQLSKFSLAWSPGSFATPGGWEADLPQKRPPLTQGLAPSELCQDNTDHQPTVLAFPVSDYFVAPT